MRQAFNRFASRVAHNVAQAWFFAACCMLILVWGPSYFAIRDTNTWQLIINTVTTIVTFLLVALLQNTQERFETRMRREGEANRYLMEELARHLALRASEDNDGPEAERLLSAILEMRNIVNGRSKA